MSAAIVFSIPALAAIIALGWAVDRALRAGFASAGFARWPLRFLTGLAVMFLFALHPVAAIVALTPAAALRWRDRGRPVSSDALQGPRDEAVALGALAVLATIAAIRAATPLYWDEFVWLAKSRIEQGGWGALRGAALDHGAGVFPPGYPLLWSLAPAWLTAPWHRTPLAIATWWMLVTAVALWLWSLREALEASAMREGVARSSVALAALMLGATPLLVVHLRASYADLPVGLLAASIALLHARALCAATPLPHLLAARCVIAVVLVGLKDEGFVHLAAVTLTGLAAGLIARRTRIAWENLAVLAAGAIPLVTWRLLLARHGVTDADHALGACALGDAPGLTGAMAKHAIDLTSWGVLWPLALGVVSVSVVRRGGPPCVVRALSTTMCAMVATTLLALLCGPERVREFAFGGSLLNRVLVQLAPLAIGVVVTAVAQIPPREAATA